MAEAEVMPKSIERKLRRTAKRRGYSRERADRYVFGTMANINRRRKEARHHG
jgi:hypothetical protein